MFQHKSIINSKNIIHSDLINIDDSAIYHVLNQNSIIDNLKVKVIKWNTKC